MLRLGCLVVFVVLVSVPVIAGQFLPWWGTMLIVIGEAVLLVIGGPRLIAWGLKRTFIGMFQTKSRVLQGAAAHVYSVAPTDEPVRVRDTIGADDEEDRSDEDEDEDADTGAHDEAEPEAPQRYVLVDVQITPRTGASKMTHWEPGEMQLVPIDAKVDMDADPTSDGAAASVETVRLVDETGEPGDAPDKIVGPARLQITFACPITLTGRVKFRYYFESFGELMLPG